MSVRELKTFEYVCDRCFITVRMLHDRPRLPEGWHQKPNGWNEPLTVCELCAKLESDE